MLVKESSNQTNPLNLRTLNMKSFFFQAEDGIRDLHVTGVQTCALPISGSGTEAPPGAADAEWAAGGPDRSRRPDRDRACRPGLLPRENMPNPLGLARRAALLRATSLHR